MNDTQELDVSALMRLIWSRRLLMIIAVSVAVGLFVGASFLITPVYRATTVLVPSDVDRTGMASLNGALGDLGGLAALMGVSVGSDLATEESLAVLRSREFTEQFIEDLDLMPELFKDRWDPNAKTWKGDSKDHPTMAEGFKYFDREVRGISQEARTGLVTVRVDWTDPVVATNWANELVTRLNSEMRARAIANTNASVGYLEKELIDTAIVDTREAISRLMEAQINRRMLANVTQEYAFRVVDRALPPDLDDPIRPRRLFIALLGAAVGALVGLIGALARRGY
jgi:uncharacterized protein involved in exopolysaccharide biosynthesis